MTAGRSDFPVLREIGRVSCVRIRAGLGVARHIATCKNKVEQNAANRSRQVSHFFQCQRKGYFMTIGHWRDRGQMLCHRYRLVESRGVGAWSAWHADFPHTSET